MAIETLASLITSAGHSMPPVLQRSESISSAVPGTGAYDAMTFGSPTYTGRSVNPNTAMTYTAVWACIKILSEAVSSIPLLTYRNLSPDGLMRTLATDDYRYRMLREQPNPEMSSMQWREFLMTSLLAWGNSYNYLDMDGRGRIKRIYPMRPDWTIPLRNVRTLELEYRYDPMYPLGGPVPAGVYSPDQILHIPGMGYDGIVGYSPITMCRNAIALGQAMEEHGARTFGGGAIQKLALVAAPGVKISDPDQVKKAWKSAYGGLDKTGEIAILQGGLDVKTFGISPRDSQFLEGRSWQLAEIARIFNVPLGLLNDVLSKPETYASAEQSDLRFVKYSIRPYTVRIEQKLNQSVLASQDSLTCTHDLTELLRGDLLSQAQAYNSLCGGGIMRRNEARVKLDFQPDSNPAADELTVQQQYVVLGQPPPPAAPAAKKALPAPEPVPDEEDNA